MRIPRNAHDPIPTGFSRDSIIEIAELAAKKWNFQPGNLCAPLWRSLGGRISGLNEAADVIIGTLPSDQSDRLVAYGDRDYLAMVQSPNDVDRPRTNLDLAIILGHVALHFNKVREAHGPDAAMVVRHYPNSPNEKACNSEAVQFALGLLAPPRMLISEWKRLDGNIPKLRELFHVPAQFIEDIYAAFAPKDEEVA